MIVRSENSYAAIVLCRTADDPGLIIGEQLIVAGRRVVALSWCAVHGDAWGEGEHPCGDTLHFCHAINTSIAPDDMSRTLLLHGHS